MPKDKKEKLKEIYEKISTPDEKILDLLEAIDLARLKGDKGDTPTAEEILAIVPIEEIKKQVTPKKGKHYFDGKIPTNEELREIIIPLIPTPIRGKDGNIITPEEIREKLKSLVGKEKLSVYDLKDWEYLKGGKDHMTWSSAGFKVYTDASLVGDGSFNNPIKVAHTGSFGTWNEEYPSSGVVNSINKIYTFTNTPSFISLEGQALSILNGDYTVLGNTVTLTNAPTNNPPINKYIS